MTANASEQETSYPTIPEPTRVEGARIPLALYVRRSAADPRHFDIVDDSGDFLAKDIADLNTARLFAAAPLLLDGFRDMRWVLNQAFGQTDVNESSERGKQMVDWLELMAKVEAEACAPDGRFPV